MPPQFQFDSATRAGKGPEWNYLAEGPKMVANIHGSAPNWNSLVYTNDLGGQPQEVRFRLHNLDQTVPTSTSDQVFVQVFVIPPGSVTVPDYSEIYNVGLQPTETWESPVSFPLNPGCQLLAMAASYPSPGISICVDIHTVV